MNSILRQAKANIEEEEQLRWCDVLVKVVRGASRYIHSCKLKLDLTCFDADKMWTNFVRDPESVGIVRVMRDGDSAGMKGQVEAFTPDVTIDNAFLSAGSQQLSH